MQKFSLLQTRADIKGEAYEQLVGANLRGDRGEYFTPRNVCEMAIQMVFATYPTDRWLDLEVIDPACGTGGFLVSVMNVWRKFIYEQQQARYGQDETRVVNETNNKIRDVASRHLVGIDFNPVLVRAAQMNLVMHGDGSTNVFQANSLIPPGEWSSSNPNNVRGRIRPGSFDVVVTNPPFGANIAIDDPHILSQFELTRFGTEGVRNSLPPEQLFIERCLYLLKPGGRMAIVLPDSILSNPGLVFIRRWILKQARVVASVDLPQVTFEPYTGTQTSVLILQKKTEEELRVERETQQQRVYDVFMTTPQAVGHDKRGHPHLLRTPEGAIIEYDEELPVQRRSATGEVVVERRRQLRRAVHDDLPEVVRYFQEWIGQPERMRWLNG
jgi:type I restriction enzyme M protein